jgi:hypothetical protein
MKILILSFFLITANSYSCEIKKELKFVSLSATLSNILERLDLLNDPNLVAISKHHPVESTANKLGGGIYLSAKILLNLKANFVVYDESIETSKSIKSLSSLKSIELKTRKRDPFEITSDAITVLPQILKSCDLQIKKMKTEIENQKQKILNGYKASRPIYFFIGKLTKNKIPQYVLGNDSFVKFLVQNRIIESYSSELPVISWSEKELKGALNRDVIFVGITNGYSKKLIKIDKNYANIDDARALLPGSYQIDFMSNFLDLIRSF